MMLAWQIGSPSSSSKTGSLQVAPPFGEPSSSSPQEGLESIQIAKGFRIELVASEPLIHDPVAIAWDADSRLYVVEMPAYMPDVHGNNEDNPIGRIMELEDTDNDGTMDKSTAFLEGLVTPDS
jgi:glucose/arabinose dehydrogenase